MSTGGAYDFMHWDLAEARQLASIRTDYHIIKNYNFMGRFDTLILKDADFFAIYRPWYDAFGTIKSSGMRKPGFDWPEYDQHDLQQNQHDHDHLEKLGSPCDGLVGEDLVDPFRDLQFPLNAPFPFA